jgi:phospho-N-acetylmuramoyl-pentapeptide-transferase
MLYYLFEYLDKLNFPGAGAFQYLTVRMFVAVILSLTISLLFGKKLINILHKRQVAETIRTLGLDGEQAKRGTPTMGGLIIIAAILIPTILCAQLDNIYILLLLFSTVWLGAIGFIDDYIKVFKKNKKGLAGKFKVVGQVVLGLIVGLVLYFNEDVQVKYYMNQSEVAEFVETSGTLQSSIQTVITKDNDTLYMSEEHSTRTTIPFLKSYEFDYSKPLGFLGERAKKLGWLLFIPIVIIIITAVSNGANLTDGIDGLAAGTSAIIVITLGILAYLSGSVLFANYLNLIFIPDVGELMVFAGAMAGACIGFLWYNTHPAEVFMGDTGSLTIGGLIAIFAIMIRKELLIPILCGVFLIENLSVMIQVAYFKYTKKKYGEGKRVFLMSPIHHHYQKKGMHEAKIVARFWIVGILLAVLTLLTFKLR